jgi:hypothetical protein
MVVIRELLNQCAQLLRRLITPKVAKDPRRPIGVLDTKLKQPMFEATHFRDRVGGQLVCVLDLMDTEEPEQSVVSAQLTPVTFAHRAPSFMASLPACVQPADES